MSVRPPAAAGSERIVELRIPADRRFHAVGRLVAGGLASRLELDVERIDDLRLAVEALLLQPPAGEALELTMTKCPDAIEVQIGPFSGEEDLEALDRVLRVLADDVEVHRSERGEMIAVRVTRGPRPLEPAFSSPFVREGR